ncbi:hypothetical protein [Streptococcus parasuis]|uniref:Uncharacterized protein n=1 Tax=Streptococcus parasuis TaxID=1501662 RepID=A0ABV2EW21_9STRE|nr:hypothetical protein [Streptococcus parasuis]
MEAQSLVSHQHSWWFSCFSLREKLARSHNINKGQITLLDLFVPIILYFFTSDNADETFKFGIFQYHCSVFIAPDRALYPFCLYVFSPVTQS